MGDLIDLHGPDGRVLGEEHKAPEFEAFLAEEGLELLADYRSIEDASVRKSIREMIGKSHCAPRKSKQAINGCRRRIDIQAVS